MIRFACPRCKAVLERPENVAGSKFACPSCGQRLQVPLPPENKTLLGNLVGSDVLAAAERASQAPVQTPGQAQFKIIAGREHVLWNCPLCQKEVDVARDLGQETIRCPHCAKK